MRHRTAKNWATTILADLEELKLNVTIEEITQIRHVVGSTGLFFKIFLKQIHRQNADRQTGAPVEVPLVLKKRPPHSSFQGIPSGLVQEWTSKLHTFMGILLQ